MLFMDDPDKRVIITIVFCFASEHLVKSELGFCLCQPSILFTTLGRQLTIRAWFPVVFRTDVVSSGKPGCSPPDVVCGFSRFGFPCSSRLPFVPNPGPRSTSKEPAAARAPGPRKLPFMAGLFDLLCRQPGLYDKLLAAWVTMSRGQTRSIYIDN